MENEILYLKLDDIIPNRFQPREIFDEESLNKLADSIRQHGVIEPIIVRPVSNKFEIIAGERRYKASVLAGLTKIPAIVKQYDDKESSIVAYIENEHRSGVSAIEEARTINRLLKSNNITQEDLAKELGISQSTLANKLRLLNLPLEVQDALMHNEISERHARSLLSVKDENKQIELLKKIKERRMTVRELDSEINSMNNENIYNENNNLGMANPVPEPQNANPDFMNFLNNYDNNNPLPVETPETPVNNGVSSMPEMPTEPVQNNDFMKFLNNYDNNPASMGNSEPPISEESEEDQGFMNFLNNYDNNNPLPQETPEPPLNNEIPSMPEMPQTSTAPAQDDNFMNFLNNYDNNLPPEQSPIESPSVPEYNSVPEVTNSNVVINDVTPPITTDFNANQYVEDNPNYEDITKNVVISSVDEIINKLKVVVDEIKTTSKFKIDTDEINYDDLYQITIKIDKRDF